MSEDRASLRSKLQKAIYIPTAIALVLTTCGVLFLGWSNYQNYIQRQESEIISKSNLIARRASAELLIGERGAPLQVIDALKTELGVSAVNLLRTTLCENSTPSCAWRSGSKLKASVRVPSVSPETFIEVTIPIETFQSYVPYQFLVWAGLPIFLVIGLGTLLQQRQLRKYIERPIATIVGKTSSGMATPPHWPAEFAKLHFDLGRALDDREKAVVGQIASGVIHDLKTLMQPLLGAVQLAAESNDPVTHQSRVDLLLRACGRNLPKIQSILDSILDGNREIKVQLKNENISNTILSAIRTAREATTTGNTVLIDAKLESCPQNLRHDPVQLERALSNLIKNAIEAASTASAARVSISTRTDNQKHLEINIEDSGPGLTVPIDVILERRRSTKMRGTGLGLFVSNKIIAAHSWALTQQQSEKLRGANFTIHCREGATL
jgi:signal transduction histidine kinase